MQWYAPCENNGFLWHHVRNLLWSYEHFLAKPLFDTQGCEEEAIARQLFHAPFAIVSHGTESDPIFNYANQTALTLFATDWQAFTSMPSRFSAEPVSREERARLLERVTRDNYIDDYQGVRIAKNGTRFLIKQAIVWNVVDGKTQTKLGQAAAFSQWETLDQ